MPITVFAQSAIQEYKLSNGLKIIVQEDHRSPVVVSQVWYRAGSIDEVNGKTGVAHVLEHMMFKGTSKVPAGQFSRLIAAAGGKENAFTSTDYTCYFQQLEKSHLPLAFKLEADRMANLKLTKKEFDKEIKVVMEERRWRTDDKPQSMVNEAFQGAAYRAHPYSRPVVGFMNDLENMTYEDAREWYQNWYAPNNATLVVVGDVKAKEVYKLAQQHFGKLKPKVLPARKPQVEPAQIGERNVIVKAPAKQSYLLMGYHVPAIVDPENDWEPYALEVLAGVLSGNPASRLNQKLVRETQLAVDASAGYDILSRGRLALFALDGTPSEGKTVAELKAALLDQIEKVKAAGVTVEELDRVKAGVIAADVYQRDSMFYQAMQIGTVESIGFSWKILDGYPAKLRAVTPEQVQAVAKKYLLQDNLTVATLDPQPMDPNAKPQGKPHVH
ncbi:pitrilysin family protein [Methylotenera sp.]|uniref:M16 family metallopeptidase n=2 Tax=Methylotenera sp. TaxID=2051956 RepID=UPI0027315708|nr:pitrilysin family protein [Methylotenera sp.]MDP2070932.1 pitrilysin family protein [Methylotenera sp.]MDP2231597.1 pitrilysin family protein [Methylotenera sp.]MDP3005806.1 pitrilysin family protein [Methylotenera sp.]